MASPSYAEYIASLSRITAHVDPTTQTAESLTIKRAAASLAALPVVDLRSLASWIQANPGAVPVLGLVVGLSQEKLKNALRQHLGSSSWTRLSRESPAGIVAMLDTEFGLVRTLATQRREPYTFADVLIARAGTRVTATSAGAAGRLVEDRIETVAAQLGLPYAVRTRFEGRNRRTAPCDLAMPAAAPQPRSWSLRRLSIRPAAN